MTKAQEAAIRRHGEHLLAIFPDATERDPVALCKKLRALEAKGNALALRCCNGPEWPSEEAQEAAFDSLHCSVARLLYPNGDNGWSPSVQINRDPRGYALKILDTTMRTAFADVPLHRDWGGYGIIAPEIGKDGIA